MINFGIITTPREVPTVNYSIKSLRAALGNIHVDVFAEPGQYLLNLNNATVHFNDAKKGCFRNFDAALRYLVNKPENEFVCVLSDDIIYCDYLRDELDNIIHYDKPVGCFDLYTHAEEPNIADNYKGDGWHRIVKGWHSWSALSVMRKETAREMMAHPFYVNHLENYEKNEQIDACVHEVFYLMGLPCYTHIPSLTYTCGQISSISHNKWKDGYNFKQTR